jgi:hypothetical protein
MIGSAQSCATDIQKFRTLSYGLRRMGLEAAALPNFSQLFLFVSQVRNCSGGMYTSCFFFSVVPKKKILIPVMFVVCFLD